MLHRLAFLVLLSATTTVVARAQGASLTVQGFAYDSVRREALANAFVTLGGVRSATTDSLGRFEFERVAPGVHLFELQHARLDSMGLPGLAVRTTVTEGREFVTIAIPAFATLWRAACGERTAPTDSGFVYGTVRDVHTGRPLPDAVVELVWIDLAAATVQSRLQMQQRLMRNRTSSDANGEFSVCGVPIDVGFRLIAGTDSLVSGLLDLLPNPLPVQRRDLVLGAREQADSASLGEVVGRVVTDDDKPVKGVRVIVDDGPRGVTTADGRFLVRGVLPGTRQIELLSIGLRPLVLALDVEPRRVTTLQVSMERLSTLDVVRVLGSPFQRRLVEEFAEVRRMGFGSFMDSSAVGRRGTIESVFATLPGVELTRQHFGGFQIALPSKSGGKCPATIWIDGVRTDTDDLRNLRPSDIAELQVFQREYNVPSRYWTPQSDCGAAVVWTKSALR